MKRFLACLALCASLTASAQDDNCTVLGIQELTQMVLALQTELDSVKDASITRDTILDIAVGVAWRGELVGANLSGVNLIYGELPNVDLSGANLSGANLNSANLEGANLNSANLTNALLEGTDLRSTSLIGANLSGASFSGAKMAGANLSGANLSGATMTCIQLGCPNSLPSGYICELDTDCGSNKYRIVPE